VGSDEESVLGMDRAQPLEACAELVANGRDKPSSSEELKNGDTKPMMGEHSKIFKFEIRKFRAELTLAEEREREKERKNGNEKRNGESGKKNKRIRE